MSYQASLKRNSSSSWASRKDKGFTLIELLVVLILLGAIASFSVWWVRSIQERALKDRLTALKLSLKHIMVVSAIQGGEADVILTKSCREVSLLYKDRKRKFLFPKGITCCIAKQDECHPVEGNLTFRIMGLSTNLPEIWFRKNSLRLKLTIRELLPFSRSTTRE